MPFASLMGERHFASVFVIGVCLADVAAGNAQTVGKLEAQQMSSEIIVTGTRTRDRTVFDSAVPIDVISRDTLRSANGTGDLGDTLEAVVPSLNLPYISASGAADNIRAPRLRGLYPDQVLVLINGKRRHHSAVLLTDGNYSAGTSPTDFDAIPNNAISRIEVLRDGAGSQYGSDAIAGVINVVLKDGVGDGELSASYGGFSTRFEPTQRTVNDGQTVQLAADYGIKIGSDGFMRLGILYRDRQPTNRSGFDQVPSFEDARNRTVAGLAGQVNFASGQGAAKEFKAYLNTVFSLGASEAYSFATLSLRDSTGTAFFRYPFSSAGLRDENLATTVFPTGYLPRTIASNDDYSMVVGVRGYGEIWDWDLSTRYARNKFDLGAENTLNPSLGEASPTKFKTALFELDHLSLNADMIRRVPISGFHSPLNVAFGVEIRRESWSARPGDPAAFEAGPVRTNAIGAQGGPVLRPQDAASLDRSIVSAYVDLEADVTRKLAIGASGRFEHYSNVGDALTGKVSARYFLFDTLNLRASVSNSVRAPTLAQQGYGATDQVFSASGMQQLVDRRILPTTSPVAEALGAERLKQEKSVNYSFGLSFRPIPALTISIDGYRIDIRDRIQISQQINSALVRSFIQSSFGLDNIERVQYFTNLSATQTTGFDIVASYATKVADGDLNLTAAYNNNRTKFTRKDMLPAKLAAIDPSVNLFTIDGLSVFDAAPRTRAIFSADWNTDRIGVRTSATRFGRTTRNSRDASRGRRHDWQSDWSLDVEAEYRFANGLSIAAGANNLFDAYPEQLFAADAYFGNLPYDFTVPLGYNGSFYYIRGRLSF